MLKKRKKYNLDKSCRSALVDRRAISHTRWLIKAYETFRKLGPEKTGGLLRDLAGPFRQLGDRIYPEVRLMLAVTQSAREEKWAALNQRNRCEWVLGTISALDFLKEDSVNGREAKRLLQAINKVVLELSGDIYDRAGFYVEQKKRQPSTKGPRRIKHSVRALKAPTRRLLYAST